METTLTSKGHILIPSKLRKKFEIKEGTRFHIEVDEERHRIILKPITRKYIHHLYGKFRGKGLMESLIDKKNIS